MTDTTTPMPTAASEPPLLLRGGLVLAEDCASVQPADVLLAGERIAAAGPDLAAPPGAEVWDLHGDLVLPGLVNAHYHSPDNLNTGRLPVAPLELWSLASVPGRQGTPEELRLAVLLGAAQLLRSGVTGVVDMVRPFPALTPQALDTVAAAYAESGLRAALVPVVADLPLERTLPLPLPLLPSAPAAVPPQPSAAEQLGVVEEVHRRWHGRHGRISVQVGPSGPQRCSDRLLADALALAQRLGTPLHTHALETPAQAEQARRRWGQPLLRHLEAIGALGPATVLAHVVWPEPDDPARLAARGAVVVHNPASNCALGSGRMPLPDLLAAGVSLALGTDAATCNDGLSPFEAMKLAAILHRPFEPDWRRWPTPADALRMATRGGAAALGLGDALGRVAPGCLADLVVLDARAPALLPPNHLPHQVVMRGGPELVKHVLVGGRPVVRDRALLTLDWPAIADAARALASRRQPPAPPPAALEAAVARMLADLRGVAPAEAAAP